MTENTTAGSTGTAWVYNFGASGTEGDSSMRNLLGGKGANLAEMSGIGLPVPPGFTRFSADLRSDTCRSAFCFSRRWLHSAISAGLCIRCRSELHGASRRIRSKWAWPCFGYSVALWPVTDCV